jgi:hypothetical protein
MVSVFWKLKMASRRAEAVADPLDRIATVNELFTLPLPRCLQLRR